MARLTRYLLRLFLGEALALAAVVIALLYLVQCLRILDLITVKGQDMITLMAQASLVIPLIGAIFLYICVGIGLARALGALQSTGELHIVHASQGVGGLFRAVAIYAGASALVVLWLSHFANPMALRHYDERAATMAADLVGRALVPHRFVEVVPGVTMVIGSRQGEGEITDFFADDRRDPESRRTYSARSAVIARDEQGYVMQMRDGAVQYMTADLRMSEIRFERYDLAVDLLTQQATLNENATSLVLVQRALETGWTDQIIAELAQRSAEGLRVIGMCLLILAVAGFPSGQRRGSRLPIEFVVLIIAFSDRGFSTYASNFLGPMRPAGGALGMILVGTLIIMFRMWGHLLTAPTRLLRRQPA